MKNPKVILGLIALLLVVGASVYFGKPQTQKGSLAPNAQGTRAYTLVDSALLDDDFDGVAYSTDQCPDTPAHQIVRFGPRDFTTYLGQQIKLNSVDRGLTATFDVNGKSYGVAVNQATYVQPVSKSYPGFTIRGLFAQYTPSGTGDEAIVVISRTDYNINTGCSN